MKLLTKQVSVEHITRYGNNFYKLRNEVQDCDIGLIEKTRVGRFMHWCLVPYEGTYFSNGCLKAISKFITSLYAKDKKK